MGVVKNAVILVAGFGSRLELLTRETPKCLTEVDGKPILVRCLDNIAKIGVTDVAIVLGHLGQEIIDYIGDEHNGMKIVYRRNRLYDKSNSMYSLWLAKDYLEQGAYVLEGDVIFEAGMLRGSNEPGDPKSYWFLDRFGPEFDGSMSVVDADGRVREVRIVREPLPEYKDNFYKSTGALKLTAEYGRALAKWLADEVAENNINIYYDLVIAKHLAELPLYCKPIHGFRWAEIDNRADLKMAERLFAREKTVIVLMDGAGDLPIPELGGKTPLEAANIPNINRLAATGKVGLMTTCYDQLPIGSIVANMGILGYNPTRYYPSGRASFEAMAQDLYLDADDIAFRCNLISLNERREIVDFTSGQLGNEKALRIIDHLKIDHSDMELYPGQSYRNILIVRDAGCAASSIRCHEPHRNIGNKIDDLLPEALDPSAAPLVERLRKIALDSIEQIREINRQYPTAADMLWPWSPSSAPIMPSFTTRFGIRGAIVAGLDFMRGIGAAAGMETREIFGATGYLDTDLKQKVRYAKNFLQRNDLVFIHVNAPDEESHARNVANKIRAIERIDAEVVKPLIQFLNDKYRGNYRVAVLPDHYTRLRDGQHADDPVPFLVYGKGVGPNGAKCFSEFEAAAHCGEPIKSYHFLRDFLHLKQEGDDNGES